MEKNSAAQSEWGASRRATLSRKASRQPKKETASKKEAQDMSDADNEEILVENLASGIQDTLSEPEINPQDIPVEDLVNGITNALGEGVAAIIDTGISAGSVLIKGVLAGAEAAVSVTVYGFGMVLGIVDKTTCGEIHEKTGEK